MKFGNSGLGVIISAAHYLPYIKGEDQSEYSLSSHIIDLSNYRYQEMGEFGVEERERYIKTIKP